RPPRPRRPARQRTASRAPSRPPPQHPRTRASRGCAAPRRAPPRTWRRASASPRRPARGPSRPSSWRATASGATTPYPQPRAGRAGGGKVAFTHLIGYALVQALRAVPAMNRSFTLVDGKPGVVAPQHVNLGLAIDVTGRDGSRQLLVPSIKAADTMDFRQFW